MRPQAIPAYEVLSRADRRVGAWLRALLAALLLVVAGGTIAYGTLLLLAGLRLVAQLFAWGI